MTFGRKAFPTEISLRLEFVNMNFHVILTHFDCGYVVKGFSNIPNVQNHHTNSQTEMPFHYQID